MAVEIHVFLISALGGGKRTFPQSLNFTLRSVTLLRKDFRKAVVIFLRSINWLVFITEMEGVYCAVRIGSLYIVELDRNI